MKKAVLPPTVQAARTRATKRGRVEPRAEHVSYDSKRGLIVLDLRGGAIVALPVAAIPELRASRSDQLKRVRVGFDGESISLDELDIDISVPGLLRDLVGLTGAAAFLGQKGGAAKSKLKAAAVRENGKKGGRPRKTSRVA